MWLLLARYFEDNAVWSKIPDVQFRTEIPEGDAIKLWTIVGYNGLGDSEATDDVFPHEFRDVLVFDASILSRT